MQGYVAVTDPGWYGFQSERKRKRVLFWRKSEKPVDLSCGDYFFFLIRGRLPRLIKGYGIVEKVGVQKISDAWEIHKDIMGYNNLQELTRDLDKVDSDKVAYYVLNNVTYLPNSVVTDEDIDFEKYIMAGRFSTPSELKFLRKKLNIIGN